MERKDFLLRLGPEDHEALRSLAHVTRRSMNEIVVAALHEYFTGTGRKEFLAASAKRTGDAFEVLLDKLAQ
jgi:hypothetical protein